MVKKLNYNVGFYGNFRYEPLHTRKVYPKESKEGLGDSWSVFYHKCKIMAMSLVFCVSDPHMHNSSAMHYTHQIYHVGQEQFMPQMQGE